MILLACCWPVKEGQWNDSAINRGERAQVVSASSPAAKRQHTSSCDGLKGAVQPVAPPAAYRQSHNFCLYSRFQYCTFKFCYSLYVVFLASSWALKKLKWRVVSIVLSLYHTLTKIRVSVSCSSSQFRYMVYSSSLFYPVNALNIYSSISQPFSGPIGR